MMSRMRGKHRILVVASAAALWSCTSSHDTVGNSSGDSYANQGSGGSSSDAPADSASPGKAGSSAAPRAGSAGSKANAGSGTPIRSGTTDRAPSGDVDTDDVEFQFDVTVPAGGELLRCIYAQMPTDRGVIAVPSVDSHYTPGSHHLLAYRSNLTAVPNGQTEPFDCQNGLWQINERGSYYEAQQPDEHRALPKGIAHKFQPGEVLIVQAHYINTRDNDLDAHVQMILHTMDPAEVEQEAGTIYFNNLRINIPPHSMGHASMNCTLPQDISLAMLWSHMHKRGIHFVAHTDDPEAADALGTLYEETDWSEPKPRNYPTDPAVVLHAGTHIDFACDYQNDSDNTYVFGNSAETNEMCILHGMYWPRMSTAAEQCLGRAPSMN